jgi:hypothetical protein
MNILRRTVKWLLIVVAGIPLLIVSCWWLIPDKKSSAGVEDLLAPKPVPSFAENGYFVFWGMRASAAFDPHAVGRSIVAEHERLVAANANLGNFKIDPFLGPTPLSLNMTSERCDPSRHSCLAFYQGMRPQIESDIASYAPYVERYRAIRNYPQFSERVASWRFTSPLPEYATIVTLSGLVDATIALRAALVETRQAALDELAAEVAMWRHILRDSDSLLTQMISVAVLHRKYSLASDIMSAYPDAARTHAAAMARVTVPLSVKEIKLVRSLQNEFRISASMYRDFMR